MAPMQLCGWRKVVCWLYFGRNGLIYLAGPNSEESRTPANVSIYTCLNYQILILGTQA